MKTYAAIPGTWAWRDRQDPAAWFNPTSAFAAQMASLGYAPLRPSRPFLWTTRINGDDLWRRWLAPVIPRSWERGDTKDWEAAASALTDYCETGDGPDVIIAHSHAGQVLALAAARCGLTAKLVITVSTPPRQDLAPEYFQLHKAVTRWRHLFDSEQDWIAWLGMAGDGALLRERSMPYAHENIGIPGVSHTGVLDNPGKLTLWTTDGWLA